MVMFDWTLLSFRLTADGAGVGKMFLTSLINHAIKSFGLGVLAAAVAYGIRFGWTL